MAEIRVPYEYDGRPFEGAGVDWQVTMFGHAVHWFCNKEATGPAQRYDEALCNRSYAMMRDFFVETW